LSLDIKFYHAADEDLGGAIDTGNLIGTAASTGVQNSPVGELTDTITSALDGGAITSYFKKVWMKNEDGNDIANPTLFFSMLSYPGQLSFAREKSANDTTASQLTMPSGYVDGDFLSPNSYDDRVPLFADTSALTNNSTGAVWVRIQVPAGMTADPSAALRLNFIGYRS